MRRRREEIEDPLAPELLLHAYSLGIFPMGNADTDEIAWFRPDPRAILPLDRLHVPRRLERTARQARFSVTFDRAFGDVVRGCAEGRPVWITDAMRRAFERLHELGHAHSVEVWHDGALAGGVYGLQIGGAFMAESKFHRVRDASKVALVKLAERLRERGFSILEIQYATDHLRQFGAIEIPLEIYLARLRRVLGASCRFS
jgi:leucyl/phenylalanyl-tRNA--protein transferase